MSEPPVTTEVDADLDAPRSQKRSKVLVGGIVALAVVVGGYFALGMPGMDHGPTASNSNSDMDMDMGQGGTQMG